jgi:hypothetical protein
VLNALGTYDFSKISHLCDVGGGHGYMLSRLLAQYPRLNGTVLRGYSASVTITQHHGASMTPARSSSAMRSAG